MPDSERLEILTAAVRRAVAVMLNYIDPANGVSRDDALNDFVDIFDSIKVARAAGFQAPIIVDVIEGGLRRKARSHAVGPRAALQGSGRTRAVSGGTLAQPLPIALSDSPMTRDGHAELGRANEVIEYGREFIATLSGAAESHGQRSLTTFDAGAWFPMVVFL